MSVQNSAAAHAAALRAGVRCGPWRRLLAFCGLGGASVRQADAEAFLWAHGAAGEAATVELLAELEADGWHVRHDLRIPGRRFNLDHVLVSPCGTALVVLDTKNWRRNWPTRLVGGRVYCGDEDRHEQVEDVADYAVRVADAVALRPVQVWPLVVVHGSPVVGGKLEARVPAQRGVVHVLGPGWLVPTLEGAPKARDPERAAALAARVDSVLLPYTGST